MTKARKAGSPEIVGDGKNASSARIAVAGLAMLITFLTGSARNSSARRDPGTQLADLKMSVRVYNYAEISASTLHLAESEANTIYREAGVHLEWHECYLSARAKSADSTCATPPTPADLHLRIVRRSTVTPIHALAENAGFTVGNLATVQWEPLLELGTPTGCFPHEMLGRAIAHEIGHALLGRKHSGGGIMQASWGISQLEPSASNSMLFTPDQERALQLAVKTRNRQ